MLFHFCSCVVKVYLFIHSFSYLLCGLKKLDWWSVTVDVPLHILFCTFKKEIGKSLLVVVLLFLGLCFNLFMKPHFV